jgi:YD repeat-containing protein
MKNISIIIGIICISFNLFSQNPGEEKWKENIVKNRIHTQVQWNHKYVKGKPVKQGYKNFTKRYDHKGNVIEEVYYEAGSIDQKLSYKYDNNENKVEYINYKGDENKLLYRQNITYDNSNKKIREERYNGTDYQIIKYNYDTKDRLTSITRSDIYGNIEHQRDFNYKGDICTIKIIDKGKEIGKIINTYDDQGNIIESTEYDIDGKVKEKYYYTFNGKLLLDKTKYILGNFIYKEYYSYDSKGNLVEIKKEQPKGNIFISNIYKYDKEGNLIEEEWYDDNSNENSRKTYFYNEKGIVEKVEVYYALYHYKIQYRYEYTFY